MNLPQANEPPPPAKSNRRANKGRTWFLGVGNFVAALGIVTTVIAGIILFNEAGKENADERNWVPVIALASIGGFLILIGTILIVGSRVIEAVSERT
jgi:hypothetical protein